MGCDCCKVENLDFNTARIGGVSYNLCNNCWPIYNWVTITRLRNERKIG